MLPAQNGPKPLRLVPKPHELRRTDGSTSVTGDWRIRLDPASADDAFAAGLLAEEAAGSLGARLTTAPLTADDGGTTNVIDLREAAAADDDPPLFRTQGYRLSIAPGRITVSAPTAQGRYYGVQTLRQIMRGADHEGLPNAEIVDHPVLEWRGVSDDISRGQVSTISDFRKTIRQLAFYKKNLYQPYIEDMFEFETNPDIGRGRGPITKAELRQMVEEGRRHHVTITPIFETLGHQDRLLSIPEIRPLAEMTDPSVRPWSFAAANPKSRAFVKKLMDEIAELTPGPFFHIGGDEVYDIGKGQSKALVEKEGRAIAQARYFKEMADHLRGKHGLRTLMYGDMLHNTPEAFKELPPDAILIDWHYSGTTYPTVAKMKEAGVRDFFVSPGLWSWSTFYPPHRRGFWNIGSFVAVGKKEGAMGCITSSWGDRGAENLRENNMTGFAYSAATCWEQDTPNHDEFMRRYVAVHYGVDSGELTAVEMTLALQTFPERNFIHDVYHAPMKLNERPAAWLERMDTLRADMERVRRQIAQARPTVRYEADHLDSLDHAAKRFLYIADRDTGFTRVARLLGRKRSGELPAGAQEEIRAILTSIRDQSLDIAAEYPRLWLRSNKYPMLQDVMARLNAQTSATQEFLVRLDAGELVRAPEPRGTFMWHPDDADPFTTTAEGMTYFMRVIDVRKPVAGIEIHAWGDDRVTLFLQGERPGRRVGGSGFNDVACEWIESPGLRKGENLVAMAVENKFGPGVAICTIDIRYKDGTTETISGDAKWRAMRTDKEVPRDWHTRKPSGREWKPVRVLGGVPLAPWTQMDW